MQNKAEQDLSVISRTYWKMALLEFRSPRVRIFAAIFIALRIVLKSVAIPIGPDVKINIGFFINAYGSMVYGPVVALLGAAVSDTLGWLLFPSGPYFFPFIFTEMAGSLIFALFLYRRTITARNVILSRFCIDFFVNIVMNTPIMWLYYQMVLGKSYAIFDALRVIKNLVMFPIESVLLILFLRMVIPATARFGLLNPDINGLQMNRRAITGLVCLFLFGACTTGGYLIYDYNTRSFSAGYTQQERLERNQLMASLLGCGPDQVCIVEKATSRVFDPQMVYTVAVYQVNEDVLKQKQEEDASYTLTRLQNYSRSKAAADDTLTRTGTAEIILNKHNDELISIRYP